MGESAVNPRRRLRATLFVLVIGLGASARSQIESVSLVRLIANPAEYEGRVVTVVGFGLFEHESNAVFLSSEHVEFAAFENSVGLEVKRGMSTPEGKAPFVLVTGTFRGTPKGTFSLRNGRIESITRLEVLQRMPPLPSEDAGRLIEAYEQKRPSGCW